MAKKLRVFIFGVLAVALFGAFFAMFAEPFAAEMYRQIGIDTSRWVEPMLTFLRSESAWSLLLFVLGTGAGVSLHWLATRIDARTKRGQPHRLPDFPHVTGPGLSPWRTRDRFMLKEVAYLMAGVDPRAEAPTGAALGYSQELIWAAQEGKIATDFRKNLTSAESLVRSLEVELGKRTRDVALTECVSRSDLIKYLKSKKNEDSAKELLVKLDGVHRSQLLLGTATETPPRIPPG